MTAYWYVEKGFNYDPKNLFYLGLRQGLFHMGSFAIGSLWIGLTFYVK